MLAGGSDDDFPLDVSAGKDVGRAIAAFEPERSNVERGQVFSSCVVGIRLLPYTRTEAFRARLLSSVVKSLTQREML